MVEKKVTISTAINGYMVDTSDVSKGMVREVFVFETFDNMVKFLRAHYENELPPGTVIGPHDYAKR